MDFVKEIFSLIVGLIVVIILGYVLLQIINSLYGGGTGIFLSLLIVIFFMYIFFKKGLDL
jgi:hypothetical protein